MKRIFTPSLINFAIFFISCLMSGCKKLDSTPSVENDAIRKFFTIPANSPSVIKKTVAEFERQNKITGFVGSIIASEGMPLWHKSIINVIKNDNSPSAGFDGNGEFSVEDTLVFTPIVEQDSLKVSGFFLSKIQGDSVELHLFRDNDYDNYSFGSVRSNSLTAERVSLELMKLNYQVFGYTEFIITDSLLFAADAPLDSNLIHRKVKLKLDEQNYFANNGTNTNNFLVSVIEICNKAKCPAANKYNGLSENTTGGGGPVCWTCWTITVLNDFPDGSPNPTTGSGEGGGGLTSPSTGNCETTNCRESSRILEGRFPCGNCGQGPVTVVFPDDPPANNQYQLDLQWMMANMKDSTGNPCITSALNTLKVLDTTVPRLIRNFFGVKPSFKMNIKTEYNSNWVLQGGNYISPLGGQTIFNTQSDTFEVKINTYYENITDLGLAATILHEAFHCQLLYWFRHAAILNDTSLQNQLARDYGYIFKAQFVNLDSNLLQIIASQPVSSQHHTMAINFNKMVAQALQNFGLKKGIVAPFSFYEKLAWTGLLDSKAFDALANSRKDAIKDIIFAEKDPYSTILNPVGAPLNYEGVNKKGHPCP